MAIPSGSGHTCTARSACAAWCRASAPAGSAAMIARCRAARSWAAVWRGARGSTRPCTWAATSTGRWRVPSTITATRRSSSRPCSHSARVGARCWSSAVARSMLELRGAGGQPQLGSDLVGRVDHVGRVGRRDAGRTRPVRATRSPAPTRPPARRTRSSPARPRRRAGRAGVDRTPAPWPAPTRPARPTRAMSGADPELWPAPSRRPRPSRRWTRRDPPRRPIRLRHMFYDTGRERTRPGPSTTSRTSATATLRRQTLGQDRRRRRGGVDADHAGDLQHLHDLLRPSRRAGPRSACAASGRARRGAWRRRRRRCRSAPSPSASARRVFHGTEENSM